jgi:NTP pyrophosphatase (non-canonical NTP hydrolase)
MDLKDLQIGIKELSERSNKNLSYDKPEVISYMKIIEEIGEITNIMVETQLLSRKDGPITKERAKEELGRGISDAIIALFSLANNSNIDMNEAIKKKMSIHDDRYKYLK